MTNIACNLDLKPSHLKKVSGGKYVDYNYLVGLRKADRQDGSDVELLNESNYSIGKDLNSKIFFKNFHDSGLCYKYLVDLIGGVYCPYCGQYDPYILSKNDQPYKCRDAKCKGFGKFSIQTRSAFHQSKLPLSDVFQCIFHIALQKKNVSSVQLSINTGLTQKTTWYVLHRVRSRMKDKNFVKLKNVVEVDEAFLAKWDRRGAVSNRKQPILGLLERGGRVVIVPIQRRDKIKIKSVVDKYVEKGTTIYTDSWPAYQVLDKDYKHEQVNHSIKEYVRNEVWTNGIEGCWKILKTNIRSAQGYISNEWVDSYCDEAAYKINYRHFSIKQRFDDLLKRCFI